jgi:hypothetical protein
MAVDIRSEWRVSTIAEILDHHSNERMRRSRLLQRSRERDVHRTPGPRAQPGDLRVTILRHHHTLQEECRDDCPDIGGSKEDLHVYDLAVNPPAQRPKRSNPEEDE